jgi:hypothetical protein
MIGMDILQPVIALAAWTMVMWLWMYATRIPAMNKAKLSDEELSTLTPSKFDAVLPAHVQWKAYNYNHLHEAPTVSMRWRSCWRSSARATGSTPGSAGLTSRCA